MKELPAGPSPAPADHARAPDDGDDSPIREGEERVAEAERERLLGTQYERQDFSGNTASGTSMWGNGNTQNIFGTKLPSRVRRPPYVDEVASCYAATEEFEEKELRALLDRHVTVCLSGEPESGRFTTGCRALIERFGTDAVMEILPPPGQPLAEAVHELTAADLGPAKGYLLRIDDEEPAPIVSRLDGLVRAGHARLVLIRNAGAEVPRRPGVEIRHTPPAAPKVFAAHLTHQAGTTSTDLTGHLRLADTAPLPDKPRDVARLARECLRMSVGDALDLLTSRSVAESRRQAQEVLGATEVKGRRRLPQHCRAFRLAYAAMSDRPIGDVFEATGRLLEKLDTESGWTDIGRTALEHPVATLLGTRLAAEWQADDNPARLVRVDENLVRAIFDVAWHEFDHTRPALVAWLHTLAEAGDEASRTAAVRAAVILALADFDGITRAVVDRWSRSPRPRVRLCAAQVVLVLSSANRVSRHIEKIVDGWVRGASNYQRDTAARAYAGGLRLSHPWWILSHLRLIAGDPGQRDASTIAMAVSQLFTEDSRAAITAILAEWVRSDESARLATRHAARSFVRMADPVQHPGRSGVPLLLLGLTEGEVRLRDLSLLWYPALLGSSTWLGAWSCLLSWLKAADQHPSLRRFVVDMLRDMAIARPLRRRLLHRLSRTDAPDWIATVTKEWEA